MCIRIVRLIGRFNERNATSLFFLIVYRTSLRNEAISASLKQIESNPKIQSVIISSSNPAIFSAGLDITELISPSEERLLKFWNSLQQVYIDLYGSRLATIAAIQGHVSSTLSFVSLVISISVMIYNSFFLSGSSSRMHACFGM